MGQKIHPTGFRLAVTKNWSSKWFANSHDFAGQLKQDIDVREFLKKRLAHASVGRVVIERPAKSARITIHSARPGVVIGKKGEDIEVLKKELQRRLGVPVHVNIEEVRKPEIDAQIIADGIASQLEKRVMFIILALIVAVAAFNIVSTLVMAVTDKRGDIAILRTLGASRGSIAMIFMVQGALIGLIGLGLGVAGGVALALNIDVVVPAIERLFGVHFLSREIYFISDLPSDLQWNDVLTISITADGLILLQTTEVSDAELIPKLAARTGAPVLMGYAERHEDGRFTVRFEPAPAAIASPDLVVATTAMNAAVEAVARRDLRQYQWTYKRYTLRPPGSGEANPYPRPR